MLTLVRCPSPHNQRPTGPEPTAALGRDEMRPTSEGEHGRVPETASVSRTHCVTCADPRATSHPLISGASMRWCSSRAGSVFLAFSVMALTACADHPRPTESSPPAGPDPLIVFGGDR